MARFLKKRFIKFSYFSHIHVRGKLLENLASRNQGNV